MKNVLAIDIGYSNVKIVTAQGGAIHPGGVAPLEYLPVDLRGGKRRGLVIVHHDGMEYGAFIEPALVQGAFRELHRDYPETPAYQALFRAALSVSGMDEIDVLATGLPVDQFYDSVSPQKLAESLSGEIRIAPKRSIVVREVEVYPQPLGAFAAFTEEMNEEEVERIISQNILVLDPGHFSCDWVIIRENAIRTRSSGTSLQAMSRVLEEAAESIARAYGGIVAPDEIEKALRQGKGSVSLFGEEVDLTPYLDEARKITVRQAVAEIKGALRSEGSLDAIILTGGGASFWEESTREAFPKVPVHSVEDPVLANARGFYAMASS